MNRRHGSHVCIHCCITSSDMRVDHVSSIIMSEDVTNNEHAHVSDFVRVVRDDDQKETQLDRKKKRVSSDRP